MSINLRLLVGSFVFAILTLVFAAISYDSQRVSLDLARKLYEGGSVPLSRLEMAKETTATIRSHFSTAGADAQRNQDGLQGEDAADVLRAATSILSDIRLVLSADISADLRRAVDALRYPLSRLEASEGSLSRRAVVRELAALWLGLEGAVMIARTDLAELRSQTSSAIETAEVRNGLALLAVLGALFGFAMVLSRSLGRALRDVAARARELASGAPAKPIVPTGPREVRDVLLALDEMQARCRKIEETMLSEADTMAVRLNRQESQLAAALNNMTQALCMLDGQKRLVLCNEVFSAHFGDVAPGTPARAFLTDPRLTLPLRENEKTTDLLKVGDAIMEVKRRGMAAKGLLITFEDITEKQRISQRLEHVAGHDGLTDLPNRKHFGDLLDGLLAKGRQGLVAAVVDIRSFKSINDTHGHPVGDAILKECGERLVRIAGPKATVSRLGGNEFAVALPGVRGTSDADAFARTIVASFDQPFDVESRRIEAGGSVGIVHVAAGGRPTGLGAAIVLQNCDLALYQAKQETGSAYRRFQPAMREKLQQRREMELDLQKALEEDQFELFYQPFIDTERRGISGFEALLRWHHPERGMVSPAVFIPLAEETGLIERLGKWALETACSEASHWHEDLTISVNLSAVQFKSDTLVSDVRSALVRSGLAPRRLQIEVTESLFLDEGDKVLSILKEFRRLGLTISMDDFGTGYSSLGYLSRFPFDKIKIDQSFVRDMTRAENIAIVRSIIGLSRALNMSVIAEGIETPEQMQILYGEGCREMQGYFFSRPRPSSDLAKMLVEVANQWRGDLPALQAARSDVAA